MNGREHSVEFVNGAEGNQTLAKCTCGQSYFHENAAVASRQLQDHIARKNSDEGGKKL